MVISFDKLPDEIQEAIERELLPANKIKIPKSLPNPHPIVANGFRKIPDHRLLKIYVMHPFNHPSFDIYNVENVPLNRDIYLMDEKWIEPYAKSLTSLLESGA